MQEAKICYLSEKTDTWMNMQTRNVVITTKSCVTSYRWNGRYDKF